MDINFKSGFVTIVGKPNVGKSTLMNRLIGEKLSIISSKPQTTRQSVKGFLNTENMQVIFLDTPGFVEPRYELHQKMNQYLMESLKDTDLIFFMTDADKFPTDYDKKVIALLKNIRVPQLALLNKIDLVDNNIIEEKIEILKEEHFDKILQISATNETGLDELMEDISQNLPINPPYFNQDDLTDLPMKFFAQEIIREQIFLNYKDEIPYSSAVVIEKYKDYPNKSEIRATIWLERKSQKPIVLGRGGQMIKMIRKNAEKEIHKLTQRRVKLDLWIKIKHKWRKKMGALQEFGY